MSAGVMAVTAVSQTAVAPATASTAALSGGLHAAATAATTAATAVVTVVAVAAAAVIVAKTAAVTAEAGAEALIRLDATMKRQADERITAEVLAEDWRVAACAVAGRNAAIRALAGSGGGSPLPPPLDLAGRNLCEIRDWLRDTDRRLGEARAAASKRIVAEAAERIRVQAPNFSAPRAQDFASRWAYTLDVAEVKPTQVAATGTPVETAVHELLAALPQNLGPDTYQEILVHAALATETPSIGQARTHMAQIRWLAQTAAETSSIRPDDQRWASRVLDLLGNAEISKTLTPQDHAVAADLERVAAGAPINTDTRQRAERLLTRATAAAQRAFLLERTVELLTAMGYDISVEHDDGIAQDRVVMTGGGLSEGHAGTVYVSADQISYQMFRGSRPADNEALARERADCEQVHDDIKRMRVAIDRYGVPLLPTHKAGPEQIQTDPGLVSGYEHHADDDRQPEQKGHKR